MAEHHNATTPDEIYVGYLPVPAGQRRFLRVAVPTITWILCLITLAWTRTQRDPGAGVWDADNTTRFTGTVVATPYPMLLADDAGDGRPGTLLLVEVGKHGGGRRAAPFDGQRVTISGWLVHRDARRMIELEPGDAAFHAANDRPPALAPAPEPLGRVTLRGEIVDSKCFLGVMKPGEGKTHKSCATLCITGGIPPMLVTRDNAGTPTFYLLTNENGGPLDPAAYPFIGDPVDVVGEAVRVGDLTHVRARAADIRRR